MQNIHIAILSTSGQEQFRLADSINIGVKFETKKLAFGILPDIWGIGYRGRCL